MKFPSWLLLTAFAAVCSAAMNAEQQSELAAVKMARAPLMTSTGAPTKAPQDQSSATANDTAQKDASADVFPIEMPATVEHPLVAEESKALDVNGFITTGGDIYEVETSAGIGKIEAREDAEDDHSHICNYGPVVVYSDAPCEKINKIKLKGMVAETTPAGATPAPVAQPENNLLKDNEKPSNANIAKRPNNQNGQKPPNKFAQNRPNQPGHNCVNRPGLNQIIRPGQKRPNRPIQNRPTKPGPIRPNQPLQIVVYRPNIRPTTKRPLNIGVTGRQVEPVKQPAWEQEEYDQYDDANDQYYRQYLAQQFIYDYDDY